MGGPGSGRKPGSGRRKGGGKMVTPHSKAGRQIKANSQFNKAYRAKIGHNPKKYPKYT